MNNENAMNQLINIKDSVPESRIGIKVLSWVSGSSRMKKEDFTLEGRVD
jgi:hypothetical protein